MTRETRIDALLAPFMRADAPGLAVAIIAGGKVAFSRCMGLASLEHAIPIGPDSGFRIGSVTKQFTVAAALMLAREGKLDIEAPANAYLPELPDYARKPSVRQLMNNTSGVPDFLELLIASGAGVQRPVTWEQSRDLVLRQTRLNCVPGTEFIYSAGGFLLLSMIVERIAGASMEEVMAQRLFAPLGMARTALLRSDRTIVRGMAFPYIEPSPRQFVRGGWGLESSGEGGIVSTLDDMARWAAELARPRVLGADIVRLMSERLVYTHGGKGAYGLGLYVRQERGRRVFGHGGRMPGFRAEVACYPDDDLALVVLTNLHGLDPYALGRRLAAAWFGDSDDAPQPAEGDLLPAGRFLAEGGEPMEIRYRDGQPILAASSGPLPLEFAGDGWWEPVATTWDLGLRRDGEAIDVTYCGSPLHYVRVEPPASISAAELCGDFANRELGSVYAVREAAGGLTVHMQGELGYYDTVLEPIAPDLFRAAPADPRAAWNQPLLRFLRKPDGAVEGLVYSTDRTRGLHFTKIAG